jgi:hypothetical protein
MYTPKRLFPSKGQSAAIDKCPTIAKVVSFFEQGNYKDCPTMIVMEVPEGDEKFLIGCYSSCGFARPSD